MYDLSEIMARLVAMQKEAVPGCDSVPRYFYSQEAFPYWINRWASMVVEPTNESIVTDRYTILMRFVIGHYTEGYQGRSEEEAYSAVSNILSYFDRNKGLTSLAYPDEADWLIEPLAEIVGVPNGFAVMQNSGIGVNQVGIEFSIDIPCYRGL